MNELSAVARDSRPIVRARQNRLAPWLFAGVAAVGAAFLFTSLERSRALRDGADAVAVDVQPARPMAELQIPAQPVADAGAWPQAWARPRPAAQLVAAPRPQSLPAARQISTSYPVPTAPAYQPEYYQPAPPPQMSPPTDYQAPPQLAAQSSEPPGEARAQRLQAPSFTVVEGTMIPAILETAMDSTSAGPVRAIVSRDVRSFDASRVLVPRGSRLIGDYSADVSPGQNRAVVNWTRLIRPDGVTINLKAPATDALGRAGVRGKVNNHTFRRLTDTLLQTMVNVGTGYSQRAAPIIVMPTGGAQVPSSITLRDLSAIKPTLRVAQGTRVNVFVSQDLDFSSVDGAQ